MADAKDTLQALRAFEREANAERREARQARADGVGLLTPALLRKHLKSGADLALAYGRKGHTLTFTVDDLKRFVRATERKQKEFRPETRGVPLLQLEKASAPEDVARSRNVRAATLYKVRRNLLFFRVTGNARPHYQVRVRLEDWDQSLHATGKNALRAARSAAVGRISFDCSCGRHQYWYRYLTNIGGFDVNPPKEQDFPKIRNPGLKGCCCKHVLKVLRVLKSNTVHAFLAQELTRQAARVGFADAAPARFLNRAEVRQVSAARGVSRDTREGRAALERFQREAQEFINGAIQKKEVRDLLKKAVPRNRTPSISPALKNLKSPQRKKLIMELQDIVNFIKLGRKTKLQTPTLRDSLKRKSEEYKKLGVTIDDLKALMREEGIA